MIYTGGCMIFSHMYEVRRFYIFSISFVVGLPVHIVHQKYVLDDTQTHKHQINTRYRVFSFQQYSIWDWLCCVWLCFVPPPAGSASWKPDDNVDHHATRCFAFFYDGPKLGTLVRRGGMLDHISHLDKQQTGYTAACSSRLQQQRPRRIGLSVPTSWNNDAFFRWSARILCWD